MVVVQAGDRGRFVGRVEVRLARMGAGWRVAAIDAGLVPVRATTREHPGVARLLAAAAAPLGVPVAWADTAVTHVRSGHTPMGSLAAAAVLAAAGAQVALLDRGAIQDGLEAGPITRADLLRVHPWRNRVVRALLTGAQLRAALAEADLVCAGEACAAAQDSTGAQDHGDPAAATDHQYVVAMGEYARAIAPSLKHIGVENTGLRVDTALELYLATSIRAGVPIPR